MFIVTAPCNLSCTILLDTYFDIACKEQTLVSVREINTFFDETLKTRNGFYMNAIVTVKCLHTNTQYLHIVTTIHLQVGCTSCLQRWAESCPCQYGLIRFGQMLGGSRVCPLLCSFVCAYVMLRDLYDINFTFCKIETSTCSVENSS